MNYIALRDQPFPNEDTCVLDTSFVDASSLFVVDDDVVVVVSAPHPTQIIADFVPIRIIDPTIPFSIPILLPPAIVFVLATSADGNTT